MPTVLVIDENRATLDTIGRALRGAGFNVALASTGQEGLKLARERASHLVVADLRLPDVADAAPSGSIALASPKSSTLTVPSRRTLTLAGFRSRWTTP
jgi:CheY-like chemotaxis protein